MNTLYLIILVLPFALGIYKSYINLSFNDKSLYFGVRLPIDFKITEELNSIKNQYKKNIIVFLGIIFIISSVIFFLVPEEFQVSVGIIGVFLYSIVGGINFVIANSKVAKIKKRDKWSGYSKNVVVVDLNYRTTSDSEKSMSNKLLIIPVVITAITFILAIYLYISTKNEMIPGVFGENGAIESYVKRGEIVSIWQYLFPVLMQLIINISIYFSYFIVIKSKQVINGGEVEKLKIYNKKVKNATIYYTVLIATITNIFFTVLFFWNKSNIMVYVGALLLILIISIVIYTVYYQKVIKEYRVNYEVNDGKAIINRNDDKNYIFGMFYNNHTDPSIAIPRRVGTGYDFNYGNLKVRIIAAIVGAVTIALLGFSAFVLPFSINDKVPELTKESINITGIYGSVTNKSDVSSIKLIKPLPNNLIKSNGAALQTKLLGNFIENGTYKAKLYISNSKGEVIKILKKDGSLIYINHKTKESTEKLYNMLKSYMER